MNNREKRLYIVRFSRIRSMWFYGLRLCNYNFNIFHVCYYYMYGSYNILFVTFIIGAPKSELEIMKSKDNSLRKKLFCTFDVLFKTYLIAVGR